MQQLRELEQSLIALAQRSVAIKSACSNEESTKHYLVLPVISALGYDISDPFEVQPEFAADFRKDSPERVDYIVAYNGEPAIAVECKRAGARLAEARGQLRSYFAALTSVRLGLLTNGTQFEFFVDSEATNIMDAEPFLTLDLDFIASGTIPADVAQSLLSVSKPFFQPDRIVEAAELLLVSKRLRSTLVQEVRDPSEDLCRLVLQRAGLKHLRRSSIQSRYTAMVRSAFEEAIVLPVIEMLRTQSSIESAGAVQAGSESAAPRIVTTERELSIYNYVCRRLAYLAQDEIQFAAVERVQFRDYVGKLVVYYENVRKGRLFDFSEGHNGFDKFTFPDPFGEIVTNSMNDIDDALRSVFVARVRELGAPLRTINIAAVA